MYESFWKFTSELADGRSQIFPYTDSEAFGIILGMGYEPEGKRQHIFTFLLCFLTAEFEAPCIEECLKTSQIGCEILRLDPRGTVGCSAAFRQILESLFYS